MFVDVMRDIYKLVIPDAQRSVDLVEDTGKKLQQDTGARSG